MKLGAFECIKPWDIWPLPLVQNASGVDKHITFYSVRFLSFTRYFKLPFTSLGTPLSRSNHGIESNMFKDFEFFRDTSEISKDLWGRRETELC